jgi:hypothetical protein
MIAVDKGERRSGNGRSVPPCLEEALMRGEIAKMVICLIFMVRVRT